MAFACFRFVKTVDGPTGLRLSLGIQIPAGRVGHAAVAPRVFVPRIDVRGPERRRKLIEATVRVLIDGGVAAVNHRSVSEEARLPMAATTYYFSTLDALLSATYRAYFEAFIHDPGGPYAGSGGPHRGIEAVVDGFFSVISGRSAAYRVLFELQFVASRRPDLKAHAAIYWDAQVRSVELELGVSSAIAHAVIALFDGYIVAFFSAGYIPARDQFRALVTGIVAHEGTRAPSADTA